jgi:hypothetical protein
MLIRAKYRLKKILHLRNMIVNSTGENGLVLIANDGSVEATLFARKKIDRDKWVQDVCCDAAV